MKTKLKKFSRMILFATISLFIATTTSSAKESNTSFGQFKIGPCEKTIDIDGEMLQTFELQYSNIKQPFYVSIHKTKGCRNFIVKTKDGFETMYVCTGKQFGVDKMPRKYSSNNKTSRLKINRSAFLHQRVITTRPKSNEELMDLIACYLPLLVEKA